MRRLIREWLQDDRHEFKPILGEIETAPMSPLGPLMFWLVIGVVTFFVGLMILGEMDVVVTAHGKVVPDGQVKVIQPLETGIIRHIWVKPGDFVRKGQPLVEIDPAINEPTIEASREQLAHLSSESARLRATGGRGGLIQQLPADQQALLNASFATTARQQAAKRQAIKATQARIASKVSQAQETRSLLAHAHEKQARLLAVQDLIARDELDRITNDITSYEGRLAVLDAEQRELRAEVQQAQQEIALLGATSHKEALTELSDRTRQIIEVTARLEESAYRQAKQQLLAPVDGVVSEMAIHTVGGVVSPAEKLLVLVPSHTLLQAEVLVENKDIGYVRKGLPVTLKLETYDFQKYGTLPGTVLTVSQDSTPDEKQGLLYKVWIKPEKTQLKVDGRWSSLTTGMSITAEIKVGKRRIIEFFIYPMIKSLSEGLSVR
ncbi:MAG: HlyD family type I secretion periplasmic adaptor subunit [Vampirovibrionales bacterium]|nr:HlyD family type I secretion periplasmic adaptor subunit [Vampirovibrionales bacterium]